MRQVLMDWLGSKPAPFSFPLTDWIDRRLGGEVATSRDENGHIEISLQSSTDPEAFWAALPEDSFSEDELAVRDAIFDFLATWKSKELANMVHLNADPNVTRKVQALLPQELKLEDWLERRIGGEIEIRKDANTGQQIIHLTDVARPIVSKKYQEFQAKEKRAAAAAGGKGAGATKGTVKGPTKGIAKGATKGDMVSPLASVGTVPEGPAGKGVPGTMAPAKGCGKAGKKPPVNKEEWFNALPDDQLTVEEANLRQALIDWLRDWPHRRPGNKPLHAPMYFSELGQDAEIQRLRQVLLPSGVTMRDWIERRVGGEIDLQKDAAGNTEIFPRGSRPDPPAPPAEEPVHAAKLVPVAPPAPAAPEVHGMGEGSMSTAEAFFSSLPDDEMTQAEVDLRQTVIDLLERAGNGPKPLLSDVFKDRRVAAARSALLPPEVPLRQWLERRIGGEVTVLKNEKGMFVVSMLSAADEEAAPEPDPEAARELRERFFSELPQDSFLPDEERLREAILRFLGKWTHKDPANLSQLSPDPLIKKYRQLVLGESGVPLKQWMERRMGGEVDLVPDEVTGQVLVGPRDSLSHIISRKRPREEPIKRDIPRPPAPVAPGGKGGVAVPWKRSQFNEGKAQRVAPRR